MVKNRDLVVAVLVTFCLTAMLFTVRISRSQNLGQYDPFLDITDDGKILIDDVAWVSKAFGTKGHNVTKASLLYDSGWINLTGQTNQTYTLTHNLNLTSTDMIVDARQKTQTWNNTYGGTNADVSDALVQTNDGGYATAGWTTSFGAVLTDCILIKIDAGGNMQWNKTYGGIGWDSVYAMIQTSDGGYALAGATTSFGAGDYDAYLVKTDAGGNMQWNKTYGGESDDYAHALVQTSDGGYALAADTYSFGAGEADAYLVKTDAGGNMQWNKTYGETGTDRALALVQTGDGGFALAGHTNSFGPGDYDAYLVRIDAGGNMQWNKTYGGTNDEESRSLVQTGDGGYALAGYTGSYGAGDFDFWLVKTDSTGNMQWNKTYGGTDRDFPEAMVRTSDGGYALAGYTHSFGAGDNDAYLVKTDAGGNMQWNKTYGGTNDDWGDSLVQTADGGFALAGATDPFEDGNYDVFVVKTDPDGNLMVVDYSAFGLTWIHSSMNSITLLRNAVTPWGSVRVQIWKKK
jgi:hypothetical protein